VHEQLSTEVLPMRRLPNLVCPGRRIFDTSIAALFLAALQRDRSIKHAS
jgi:hypothetical protein